MAIAFTFPGPGQPGRRHGQGPGRGLSGGPRACSTRSTRRSARSSPTLMCEGPGGDADADRQRPAGADGGLARGDARAGSRAASRSERQGRLCRRPFARRIFGALRRRHVLARRHRAAAAHARPRHADGGAGRRGRDGGAPRPRPGRRRRRPAPRPRSGSVCQIANDNGGGQLVISGDKAAVERAVELPRKRAPSAPCCCRSPHPSIAR